MLEVCIDSLESAINAINGGADEIEVCSALNDGGLTPSAGLVKEIMRLVRKQPTHCRPKVNVMIRCRGGDDFMYSDLEMQTMLRDIKIFKELDVDQFVFGALTDILEVDEYKGMKILAAASPKKVTFSRAFDLTYEYKRAAGILVGMGFHRVLTSGQREKADHPVAIKNLTYLTTRYASGKELVIMPGGGVNVDNVATFINMGCQIVHSSCRLAVPMPEVERRLSLGHSSGNQLYITDENMVRELKDAIIQAVAEKECEEFN